FLSLLGVFLLGLNESQSANLELLAIGLLGVTTGYIPLSKIDNVVTGHPYILLFVYLCYICAITVWGARYPLQIVGVCLTLMLIYLVSAMNGDRGRIRRHINLLGKYSLFGYIAQIAVLQFIFRGFRHINLEAGAIVISFFGAFALTMLTVELA